MMSLKHIKNKIDFFLFEKKSQFYICISNVCLQQDYNDDIRQGQLLEMQILKEVPESCEKFSNGEAIGSEGLVNVVTPNIILQEDVEAVNST